MGGVARLALIIVGLSVSLEAGAGLFDSIPSRIPIPARIWKGEVVDHGGVVVPLERLSFEGEVFLYGKVGAGQVTVPFTLIQSVTFRAGSEKRTRAAHVTTTLGEEVVVTVEEDVRLYGRTRYGTYAIELADVERLTMVGRAER